MSEERLASDLLILLLGWAMGESRRVLPSDLTGGRMSRATYSVPVPIDQMDPEDLALRQVYSRVVFQAWRLSGAIEQGLAWSEASRWLDAVQSIDLPRDEDCLVEICPESVATIASFALSPDAREGLYATVDVGAWTTDVSFFRVTDVGRSRSGVSTVAFYAAQSHRVAANSLDERCRSLLIELYELEPGAHRALADSIRAQREEGTYGDKPLRLGDRERTPRASPLALSRDLLTEMLWRRFLGTMGHAYEKEKFESRWDNQVDLLYSGGGSNEEHVFEPMLAHSFIRSARAVVRPSNLRGADPVDYRRLAVAYGLSFGRARWPRDILPSNVSKLQLGKRRVITSEDLGYEEIN